MSTITVSLNTELENRFMGVLSRQPENMSQSIELAIQEAIELWIVEQEQQSRAKELQEIMEKGYPLGSCQYAHRSELYDQT